MSVSEEERHELYLALEVVHGRARATTLMSLLPPVGWADVTTKRDLDQMADRMELRFAGVEHRLALIESELSAGRGERWKMFFMLVGIQLTAAGLIVGFQQLP